MKPKDDVLEEPDGCLGVAVAERSAERRRSEAVFRRRVGGGSARAREYQIGGAWPPGVAAWSPVGLGLVGSLLLLRKALRR